MYCDPDKNQQVRVNAISVCRKLQSRYFTPTVHSLLINRHQDYQAKGQADRHNASQLFFESLKLLDLLTESERHSVISGACKKLLSVHNAFDNFYNEPPFAERLYSLTSNQAVPDTAQAEFVETVVTCSVGNRYGTSDNADVFYVQMIEGFSPREIQIMLELPDSNTLVSRRISSSTRCKEKYKKIVNRLEVESIPTSLKSAYARWKD
jgi:hypothetical protein